MSQRLEVLSFLQESATTLRQMARDRPSSISPDMIRIANEIAHAAAKLEAELIDAELIAPPPANQN
jgi:hypothetical protein